MRVDERTKDVVQEWPLTTVKRWAASPKSFTLVCNARVRPCYKNFCWASSFFIFSFRIPEPAWLRYFLTAAYCLGGLSLSVVVPLMRLHSKDICIRNISSQCKNWQIFSKAHLTARLNWMHCWTLAKISSSLEMSFEQWSLWAEGQITGSKRKVLMLWPSKVLKKEHECTLLALSHSVYTRYIGFLQDLLYI